MPSIGRRSSADAPATLYIVLLSSVELAACATFRPPEISYDDDPTTGSVPGRTTEACGGRGDPEAAAASRPAQAAARRKALGPEPEDPHRSRRPKPTRLHACSPLATATSTPCRSIPTRRRAVPSLYRARTGDGYRLTGRRAARRVRDRWPPATRCAGSSATRKAGPGRRNASTS